MRKRYMPSPMITNRPVGRKERLASRKTILRVTVRCLGLLLAMSSVSCNTGLEGDGEQTNLRTDEIVAPKLRNWTHTT
jgi:hypothetical protein